MRTFGTHGRVYPEKHYVVARAEELTDFIRRVKDGRYIVLFAPRQTGKTTFFRWALEALATKDETYFPIHLNFEDYKNLVSPPEFYAGLYEDLRMEIENVFQQRGSVPSAALTQFLDATRLTNQQAMRRFFWRLASFLTPQRVVLIIDEFDGIPATVVSDFLHALRAIYLSDDRARCPYSVGIVGVKSITQLNYDRTVSPFNVPELCPMEAIVTYLTLRQKANIRASPSRI